jgi:hypothetical protein
VELQILTTDTNLTQQEKKNEKEKKNTTTEHTNQTI